MPTVDSLDIQISAQANRAVKSIDRMVGKLNTLSGAINKINVSHISKEFEKLSKLDVFSDIAKSAKAAESAMGRIAKEAGKGIKSKATFDTSDYQKATKELSAKFSNMGTDIKFTGNLSQLEKQYQKLENTLDRLAEKEKKIVSVGATSPESTTFKNLQYDIQHTLNQMDTLSQRIKKVRDAKPNVSGWQKLTTVTAGTLNSVKKLGSAFKSLQSVVGKVSSAIGKMFGNIIQLSSRATSAITSSARGMSNAFSKLSGANSGIKNASIGLNGLTKAAGGFLVAKGLYDFGRQAIQLGSDITEVENVVNTAFGSMSQKAYDFASTATEQFGLSELAAKQYSGTMMAMLKSSGVAQGAAADMSVTLAGLAGDLASFYNIDTDEAFYKLRAAIAGETEPMRALGVNMNIVNLEAFAMSQGIRKSYREMTLAEQAILRYNYILAKTGDAQGDFARTSGSMANQMRLLRLNIQSVAAIIGQGLIAALLPVIKLLNKFMEKLTQAAKKFRDFMYVLFGKKIESPARGIVNDLASTTDYTTDLSGIGDSANNISDGMENAASGTDDLAKSSKKLQKQLAVLSFDELNQLPGKLDALSDAGLSGESGVPDLGLDNMDDLGLGDMENLFDSLSGEEAVQPVNEWARKIREAFLNHDWEGLGKTIAQMVNIGLGKIYSGITGITPKVEKALRAFARVFNSFVKWLDWDLLGRTIGAGVNLLTRSFNALTDPKTGIDFVQLGRKLSVGFRGLVNEIDWTGLGNAFGNYFMIAWRLFEGFVDDMWRQSDLTGLNGWQELGRSLGEGVNGLFDKIDFGSIGTTLASGFNGVFLTLKNFTETIRWSDIADNISNGLTNAIEGIHPVEAAVALGEFVTDLLGAMLQVAEKTPWYLLGQKIGDFLINIPWRTIIGQVFGIIENVFGGLIGGLGGKLLGQLPEIGNAMAVGLNTAFAKLNDFTKSVSWDSMASNISTGLNEMIHKVNWAENGKILSDFVKKMLDTMLKAAQDTDWEAFGRGIGDFLSSIDWAGIFGTVFEIVKESIGGAISGFAETTAGKTALGLLTAFAGINLAGLGLSVGNTISKELTNQSLITKIFEAITGEGGITSIFGSGLISGFSGIFSEGGLLSTLTSGAMGLVSRLGSILGTIGSVIFSPTGLLIGGIVAGVALIIMNWDSVSKVLGDLWNNVLVPLGEFVTNVFAAVWRDILSPVLSYLAETVFPVLSETIGNLWNNVLVPLGSFLASTLGPVFSALGKTIGWLWKNILVPVASFVGTVLAKAFEFTAWHLNNVVIPIVSKVAKVFQFLGERVLKPLASFVGGVFANVISARFKAIGVIVNKLKLIFKGLINFITGTFSGNWKRAWKGVKQVFEGVWGGLAKVVKKPINAIIGFINKMVSGMASGVNDIAKMLNSLKVDIPDWVPGIGGGTLGFNIPTWKPGKIPYLASGGLVTRPTYAVMGEGYRKEAVLPLQDPQAMRRISDSILSNSTYAGIDRDELADAVAEGVTVAMMNNQPNAQSSPIYITVKLENDEAIARAAIRGQESLDYRMNPTPRLAY